jgi:hypothetical protein
MMWNDEKKERKEEKKINGDVTRKLLNVYM